MNLEYWKYGETLAEMRLPVWENLVNKINSMNQYIQSRYSSDLSAIAHARLNELEELMQSYAEVIELQETHINSLNEKYVQVCDLYTKQAHNRNKEINENLNLMLKTLKELKR